MKLFKDLIEKVKIIGKIDLPTRDIDLSVSGVVHRHKGISIINTTHGVEQIKKRSSKFNDKQLKDLFDRYSNFFAQNNDFVKNTFILLFSEKYKQGAIFKVQSKNKIVIVTFLPNGHQIAKAGTKKVLIEGIFYDIFIVD